MKFATIYDNDRTTYGVIQTDMFHAAPTAILSTVPDLKAAIASGRLLEIGRDIIASGTGRPSSRVRFAPVVPNPGKVLCVGLNYHEHRAESGRTAPTPHPVIFTRFADTLCGHDEPVIKPPESDVVDYEAELALIIGKGGRRIAKDKVYDLVAGYACFNDVSVRDWQNHTSQFTPGKNFPATGPLGPVMVTSDEIGDPRPLRITGRVDGAVMQDAHISDMIFSIPEIVSYVSGFTELCPGDIIATGTPGGVGVRRDPRVLLKDGTVIEVEIEKVGHLRNVVAAEKV